MKAEPKAVLCNENQTGERSLHPCLTKDPLEQSTLEVRQVFFSHFLGQSVKTARTTTQQVSEGR